MKPSFSLTLCLSTAGLVAAATGCNAGSSPASPATISASAPAAKKVPRPPKIVGVISAPEGVKKLGVVYLEDAPRQPGVATTADVYIHHKDFTPFIAVVAAGGTVTFGNRDALTHHMFSPELPGWDTGYLQQDGTVARRFDAPGAISLLCNIHPEMIGYLLVVPSTSFALVAPDGKYAISDVPPGTYRATFWAPRAAPFTWPVTVTADGVATANFELRPLVAP